MVHGKKNFPYHTSYKGLGCHSFIAKNGTHRETTYWVINLNIQCHEHEIVTLARSVLM